MHVAVIGGTGGMGKSFVRFLNEENIEVIAVGRKTKNSEKIIQNADILVISVPSLHIDYAVDLIRDAKVLSKDRLIVSLGSIMTFDKKVLSKLNLPILHVHQLFGPQVFPFDGQRVVISGKITHPSSIFLINLLEKSGVGILRLKEREHDKLMASIQAISQFSAISLAKTLSESGNSKKALMNSSSITFKMSAQAIERIMAQKADLWAFLQFENPFALSLMKKHLKNVQEMIKTAKNKDYKRFEKVFNKTASFWK